MSDFNCDSCIYYVVPSDSLSGVHECTYDFQEYDDEGFVICELPCHLNYKEKYYE